MAGSLPWTHPTHRSPRQHPLLEAGVPARPFGRLSLLKPPPPFEDLDSTVEVLAAGAEADETPRMCCRELAILTQRSLLAGSRTAPEGRAARGATVRGLSRGAAIADNGVVLTGELEADSLSYPAAATDAARASRLAQAEVSFDQGPGDARPSSGVSYAGVDVVGS
jgi:hypothetical protein